MNNCTKNTRDIKAAPEKVYQALTSPEALIAWQAPDTMTAEIHDFDLRVGGCYTMSLYYPETETEVRGKTSAKQDRFTSCFTILEPLKIVQTITFDTKDDAFKGKMVMEITLEPIDDGTRVTFLFCNIPPGIRPEDNEKGTESSLEKLARYVEK